MNKQTSLENRRILFIGLGQIGRHLATHLKSDGADVIASNRTIAKASAWANETGGQYTEDVLGVVHDRDVIITCVGDDNDLKNIFSDDFVNALRPNTLVIDHTTASAQQARHLSHAISAVQGRFVDAPVSGGSSGAAARKLSIMAGAADEDTFADAQSVMAAYAARVIHVGPVGAGQVCKMANQLCIAGVLEGLAEGLGLAIAAGLDPSVVVSALSGGAAKSWQLENRSSFMIQRSFAAGFAAKLMRKDLGLAISESERLGTQTPVARVVHEQYEKLMAQGLGDEDFSNLFRLVESS